MLNYAVLSDNELQNLAINGDRIAEDELASRYMQLVRACARPLFLTGGDSEDLIQEGMIGLFQAVNDYDFGRDASFFTFADLCVTRKIYNAIKASNEKKHSFLNNYVSLNSPVEGENNAEGLALLERLANADDSEPETMALIGELKEEVVAAINKELTDLERENFLLYLTGMTNSEVARVVGRSPKETDNAIQRAKVKLRKIIKSR